MEGQAGGHVGREEDESFAVVVDACEFDHTVVVVEQFWGQFATADEDNDQVLIPQSEYARQLDIKALLIVFHTEPLLLIQLY